MDRITMYPVAFVTTVQPYLLGWVLVISFFLSLAIVALVSRTRDWRRVLLTYVATYVVTALVVALSTTMLLDIRLMDVEVVYVVPREKPSD